MAAYGSVWGENYSGRLGIGSNGSSKISRPMVSQITEATQIVVGTTHGIALKANGSVWNWGKAVRDDI